MRVWFAPPLLTLSLLACGADEGSGPPAAGGGGGGVSGDAGLSDARWPDGASAGASGSSGASGSGGAGGQAGAAGLETVVTMETGVTGGVAGGALTPGGMTDTHAQFAGGPFTEVEFPFTVVSEPPATSRYFWAQQFFFEGTTQGGYTGLQQGGNMGGQVVGKMLIFSIWDALEATPGPAAACEPFGGEGVGFSCRRAFDWKVGTKYRMVLKRESPSWWSVTAIAPAIQPILLGSIRVLPSWGNVKPFTAGFSEYFGTVGSCTTLPHAIALLHEPRADGTAPTQIDAGVYGTCVAQAKSTCSGPLCV